MKVPGRYNIFPNHLAGMNGVPVFQAIQEEETGLIFSLFKIKND
jgi:hypothetical protein